MFSPASSITPLILIEFFREYCSYQSTRNGRSLLWSKLLATLSDKEFTLASSLVFLVFKTSISSLNFSIRSSNEARRFIICVRSCRLLSWSEPDFCSKRSKSSAMSGLPSLLAGSFDFELFVGQALSLTFPERRRKRKAPLLLGR